ncbi:competence protein CoiA family protein [Cellulomonas sp. HZM]|uniref:competence protein CoiA family protein n=1 Tax=Cellulomonas sp. HZM TaxID=1454010 RepID=UPI0004931BC4|nr:competence protein CoiA family protein [Cellulomonas sp. HZM]
MYEDDIAEQYARFARGETAQVLARDDRTGELVFLGVGEAGERRATALAHYSCPVPGCDSPRPLSTKGQSVRDHFFHRTAHSHPGGPESLNHLQAKHLLAEWARGQVARVVDVVVNEEEWAPDVHRRPDVMVTWPDGKRVAIEVEYKAYTPEAFRAKDEAYRKASVTAIWMFGHTGRYLRPVIRGTQDGPELAGFKLVPLTRLLAAAARPIHFVNPIDANVGTLWAPGVPLEAARVDPRWWAGNLRTVGGRVFPAPVTEVAQLGLAALNDCVLDREFGLVTPTVVDVREERSRVAGQADQDRLAWEAQEAERAASRAARSAAHALAPSYRQPVRQPGNPTGLWCSKCRRPLALTLERLGRHVTC